MQSTIRRIAPTELNVLISGKAGDGRVELAREIHRQSKRARMPLYELDAETTTPAVLARLSNGYGEVPTMRGTLLLDSIERLDEAGQAGLLEVLEEGACSIPDSDEKVRVDARLLATAENLQAAVERGEFRADLFYRLNELAIDLKPNEERTLAFERCGGSAVSLEEMRRCVERQIEVEVIRRALDQHHWDRRETAEALHITYQSLCDKIENLEIAP